MAFKNKHVFGGRKNFKATAVISSAPLPDLLKEYDLGLFVDDNRDMSKINLPKAKEWKTFKNYQEFGEYIEDVHLKLEVKPETVFLALDHYLDALGRRPTGNDCMFLCDMYRNEIAKHIDLRGHSSDSIMNDYKHRFWYSGASE